MLKQTASIITVKKINDYQQSITVILHKKTEHCTQGAACCQKSLLGRREKNEVFTIICSHELTLKVADTVTISIPEKAVLHASLLAYLLPLTTTLFALIFAHTSIISSLSLPQDFIYLLALISGFGIGIFGLKLGTHYLNRQQELQPAILAKNLSTHTSTRINTDIKSPM